MGAAIIFAQRCPACGRFFNVRIRRIGSWVTCVHCQHSVLAGGELPSNRPELPQHGSRKTRVGSDSAGDA